MRQTRMKIPSGEDRAVYHCLSRIVDRRFIFEEVEKETFVQFLREYEQFCGVQVLTFCVMSNHFHVLVEVPKRPEMLPDAEEVLRRLKGLSGAAITAGKAKQMLEMFAKARDEKGAAEYLAQFHRRMWDVSEFLKLLKQRFTQWYNHRTVRKGTLWEDRFKSVLVEGEGDPLVTMAAYIDLNPVRAGLVTDPAEYRWSGYGEAMAGRRRAKEGIRRIHGLGVRSLEVNGSEAMRGYRVRVFAQGETGLEGTDAVEAAAPWPGSGGSGAHDFEEGAHRHGRVPALPGAVFLGRRGDGQPWVCGGSFQKISRAIWTQAHQRRPADAGGGAGTVHRAGPPGGCVWVTRRGEVEKCRSRTGLTADAADFTR